MTYLLFFLTGVVFGCAAFAVGLAALWMEGSVRLGPPAKPLSRQPRDRLGRFASTADAKAAAMTAALRHDVEASRKAKQ